MNLAQAVGTLNLLGDESRIRLCALLGSRELSVTDLVRVTGISQSRVSAHLARLREGGFVRDRRDGPHAFYALAEDRLPPTARAFLDDASRSADPILEGDKRRLSELDAAQRGQLPESFAGRMDLHYSPGRTWPALLSGIAALLELGAVVDVGSGDGAAASFVAPYCDSLVCVDTSPRMIEAARERLARHAHARAEVADAEALPFPDASFDTALLFHTLTFAEHPARVVDECARVLRPGGRVVVLSLDEHEQREITAPYGERRPGLSPRALRTLLARGDLEVASVEIATREPKKPHFQVVLGIARKSPASPRKKRRIEP